MQFTDKAPLLAVLAWALLCLGLPPISGCGSRRPSIEPPPIVAGGLLPAEAMYCPDEYLRWSLRWRGIEAASTEMMSGRPGEIGGEAAIIVYSLSRSSELAAIFREVREELSSQISLVDGNPIRNESNFTEDGELESLDVEFAKEGYSASLRESGQDVTWTVKSADRALDLHTFLARLRVWQGEAGASALVQNGRRHYQVDLVVGGKEVITTQETRVPTIRIHGKATRLRKEGEPLDQPETRVFTLWRSDDARMLPLRFELETRLGDVRGSLVEFRQPELHTCLRIGEG